MCGKCSDESRDSILEFFCTDGLLTSLGTLPNFYYIYKKYFSICYKIFAISMFFDFGGKCSDESRDSILEFFCTDGLLTSLGTLPNFYYIYKKYFSICYKIFAISMFFDFGGKCSDESRDSILEFFCTDGLLTSLGTPPNFYYIYEKYFSICY